MKKSKLKEVFSYKSILINAAVFIVYFISGKLGLKLAFVNASATAVWPPTGIALASFLIFGYRVLPAIFLGAFFTNLTTAGTIVTSIGIAVGNTSEGLIGSFLVNKFANGKDAFYRAKDMVKFILLAALLSTTISASIGVATLILGGYAVLSNYLQVWLTWWLGDATGALIVTPFIIFWSSSRPLRLRKGQLLEVFILVYLLFLTGMVAFGGIVPSLNNYQLQFIVIPLVIWIAYRFGKRETMTAIVILAGIAIWGTLLGRGPFIRPSANESFLLLQSWMAIVTITAMTLAVAVSERNEVSTTLENSEKRFRALIEKSYDAVVLIDTTSKIQYASPSVKRLLGYNPDDLIGVVGFDLVIPEDRQKTVETLNHLVLSRGGTVTIEYRTIRKDKKIIWVEATGTNLLSEPNINAVVVNFRDITERKESLLEHEKFKQAVKNAIEGIIMTDVKGSIIYVNKAWEKLTGYRSSEVIGKNSRILHSGKTPQSEYELMWKRLTKGKSFKTENIINKRKDGTEYQEQLQVFPIKDAGENIFYVGIEEDISERKAIEQSKTEFLSLASHQLKTPMSTIKWFTELLLKKKSGALNKNQTKYIRQIYSASERMIELVNALLNISRLEMGIFTTEPEDVVPEDVVKEFIQEYTPEITQKKLTIHTKLNNLKKIRIDKKFFSIILQNLFSNAVHYSSVKGSITIEFSLRKGNLLLTVSDTGLGIPKAQQHNIFEKFFRADNIQTIDQKGSGLGLYLVKSIVNKIGGNISFSSSENSGTKFTVRFPLDKIKKGKEVKMV